MKVLVDATVLEAPATGIAKATVGLWRACLDLVPAWTVTAAHRKPLQCDLPSGVSAARIGRRFSRQHWRRFALPLHVARHRPDLVHFPFNGGVPRLFSRAMVVTTMHDILPLVIPHYFTTDRARDQYRVQVQRDLDHSDLVVTDSDYSRCEIVKHFRTQVEPVVVRLATHLRAARDVLPQGIHGRGDYFLYVGGYDLRKGIERLVTVVADLRRSQRLRSRLLLAGSPDCRSDRLQQVIAEAARQGAVEELGYVADADLLHMLVHAQALVYPSKYEGFGLPPLEAMTVGCPVITTRCAAIPEVCGDAALYVDPDRDRDLADALVRIEGDPQLREALRGKGMAQAAKFSWRASAETFLAEVERVLAARSHA
ncbi:MAG TPA: glycosyltransferase family 1 protein [Armatimonadota bacterium]|nr:glycosyltransferase family 1 protein [Armatimonadota bacterium]